MASFFDRIFKRGKAFYRTQNPLLACEMEIDGDKYLLEEFDLDYDGDNGKRYVPLCAVFPDKLPPELESWITNSTKRKDGVVKFYENEDSLEKGAVFSITFYGASCIRYQKTINGDKLLTTLFMAARGIKMLDQEL